MGHPTNRLRQLRVTKQITERTDSLDKYLQEIGREELITPEEEVVLAQKIKKGDLKALEKLTKANLRFVVSVAKQYQNQGLGLPDLINEGNLGLIKAAQKFDETRGFKFITYAVWWIRQAILVGIAEQSRMVRLPLNKITLLNKIKKTTSVLEQEFEREPEIDEVAKRLNSEKEIDEYLINEASHFMARNHISMDAVLLGKEDITSHDVMPGDPKLKADTEILKESLRTEITRSLATLADREREIIILYYGLEAGYGITLDEIGEKYDLTRERVRQIKENALRKLRHTSRSKLMKPYLG